MMDRHLFARRIHRMDWLMTSAIVALVIVGVLFIYSACYRSVETPLAALYKKQIIWSLFGLLIFVTAAVTDYSRLRNVTWALYLGSLALLVVVLVSGVQIHGARRWLDLFGVRIQPSEFAKLATIMVLARFLARPGRNLYDPKNTFFALLIMVAPFALIVKEPDLGTAAVLLPVTVVMMFVAGIPPKTLAILGVAGLMFLPIGWFGLDDYQKERILVFFDPGRDPLGAGWNRIQSEIAVGSGSLTGKGFLKGTQNVLGYLPSKVAPTDFIYSVIAEETGFVGSALILALFAAIFTAGMRVALSARDRFGRLLAVGIVTLLFTHVLVNIAMTIGLMPITGLPLPLISYGGTFMVCVMLSLGIVQSVYIRRLRR